MMQNINNKRKIDTKDSIDQTEMLNIAKKKSEKLSLPEPSETKIIKFNKNFERFLIAQHSPVTVFHQHLIRLELFLWKKITFLSTRHKFVGKL